MGGETENLSTMRRCFVIFELWEGDRRRRGQTDTKLSPSGLTRRAASAREKVLRPPVDDRKRIGARAERGRTENDCAWFYIHHWVVDVGGGQSDRLSRPLYANRRGGNLIILHS